MNPFKVESKSLLLNGLWLAGALGISVSAQAWNNWPPAPGHIAWNPPVVVTSPPPTGWHPPHGTPHSPPPPGWYPPHGTPHSPPPPPPYYPPSDPAHPPVIVVPGGGPLRTPPAYSSDPAEVDAVDIIARSIAGKGCGRLTEAVRQLSNELLANVTYVTKNDPTLPPPPMLKRPSRPMSRDEFMQRWLEHLTNRDLMAKLWKRLADLYSSCNKPCFDDGVAVGQISGTGYCAASIGVGGLVSLDPAIQPPLPICSISTFTGCQQGYYNAVNQYQGCGTYTTGSFDQILRSSISQDCHMEQ